MFLNFLFNGKLGSAICIGLFDYFDSRGTILQHHIDMPFDSIYRNDSQLTGFE